MIFWVAAVFLLPVLPIWPLRRPFLPYSRPNLALAGLLVRFPYSPWVQSKVYVDLYSASSSIQTSNALERSLVICKITQCYTCHPAEVTLPTLLPGIHQYSFYRPTEGGRLNPIPSSHFLRFVSSSSIPSPFRAPCLSQNSAFDAILSKTSVGAL